MFAHDANPLHILDRLRFDPGDLIAVEVKCRHTPQQEVGCFGAKRRQRTELGSRHPDIFGDALDFRIGEALQLRFGTASGPVLGTIAEGCRTQTSFYVRWAGLTFHPPLADFKDTRQSGVSALT